MPDKLKSADGLKTLVDFTGAFKAHSREAKCVYLKGFTAYKLFTSKDQADNAATAAHAAKNAGVPVARDTRPAYKATFVDESDVSSTVYVLESERHIGHFFQLSKRGHVERLYAEIRAVAQGKPEVRAQALRALQAAQAHGVTDPQGFFDPTLGMPIRFFDVHAGTSAAPQIQTIIGMLSSS